MPRKPLNETVIPASKVKMARLVIEVPENQITLSPDGRFINLPWGALGTFAVGSKTIEARMGKAGKVIILTKAARKASTKAEKPSIDLSRIL